MEGESLGTTVAKLFAHGILFSVITTLLVLIIAGALFGLVIVGLFFGGLVGFLAVTVVLFILIAAAYGFANAAITRFLWFPVRGGFGAYLGHGLLLGLILIFAQSIPVAILTTVFVTAAGNPALLIPFQIVLTILFAFVTGYAGRWVAGLWRTGPRTHVPSAYVASANPSLLARENNPEGKHCPRCGRTRLIVASDRSAFCIDCQRGFPTI